MSVLPGQVRFNYLTPVPSFKNRRFLKGYIYSLIRKEGKSLSILNYVFCTDEYLLPMNKKYLKHNTLTDIITFELNRPGDPIVSDVYISVERVKENAKLLKIPFQKELLRVIFHGALHLCGYTDKKEADVEIMRSEEDHHLKTFLLVSRETQRDI